MNHWSPKHLDKYKPNVMERSLRFMFDEAETIEQGQTIIEAAEKVGISATAIAEMKNDLEFLEII